MVIPLLKRLGALRLSHEETAGGRRPPGTVRLNRGGLTPYLSMFGVDRAYFRTPTSREMNLVGMAVVRPAPEGSPWSHDGFISGLQNAVDHLCGRRKPLYCAL